MVSLDPDAVMICCSLVPANCPKIACVIAVGGWIVREYMNICDVVAMMGSYVGSSPDVRSQKRAVCGDAIADKEVKGSHFSHCC